MSSSFYKPIPLQSIEVQKRNIKNVYSKNNLQLSQTPQQPLIFSRKSVCVSQLNEPLSQSLLYSVYLEKISSIIECTNKK